MILGYNPVLQALLGTLLTWGLTAAGSALVFIFSSGQRQILDGSLGFAAGKRKMRQSNDGDGLWQRDKAYFRSLCGLDGSILGWASFLIPALRNPVIRMNDLQAKLASGGYSGETHSPRS